MLVLLLWPSYNTKPLVQKYHITTRYYNIYTKTDVAECAVAFLKFLRTVLHRLPLKIDGIPIFQKKKRKKLPILHRTQILHRLL